MTAKMLCPQCEKENSIKNIYCSSCGDDMDSFKVDFMVIATLVISGLMFVGFVFFQIYRAYGF